MRQSVQSGTPAVWFTAPIKKHGSSMSYEARLATWWWSELPTPTYQIQVVTGVLLPGYRQVDDRIEGEKKSASTGHVRWAQRQTLDLKRTHCRKPSGYEKCLRRCRPSSQEDWSEDFLPGNPPHLLKNHLGPSSVIEGFRGGPHVSTSVTVDRDPEGTPRFACV